MPRGWGHFAFQFVIWMGFYVAYQVVRGAADRDVVTAFQQRRVGRRAQRTGSERSSSRPCSKSSTRRRSWSLLTSYTYWLSQFAVVGVTLLWVYFRHHERFAGFRNWLIAANLVGLVGYVLMPTAPPRMFPEWGFIDTLGSVLLDQPRQRPDLVRRQPVRGNAEPPRDGRADRRHRDGGTLSELAHEGRLARVARRGSRLR